MTNDKYDDDDDDDDDDGDLIRCIFHQGIYLTKSTCCNVNTILIWWALDLKNLSCHHLGNKPLSSRLDFLEGFENKQVIGNPTKSDSETIKIHLKKKTPQQK